MSSSLSPSPSPSSLSLSSSSFRPPSSSNALVLSTRTNDARSSCRPFPPFSSNPSVVVSASRFCRLFLRSCTIRSISPMQSPSNSNRTRFDFLPSSLPCTSSTPASSAARRRLPPVTVAPAIRPPSSCQSFFHRQNRHAHTYF